MLPLLALLGSYLVGSIPTAYLLVRWVKRVDVRTVGSGNVGATNVARVVGNRAGIVVFLLDAGKGLVAVWGVAPWLVEPLSPAMQFGCGTVAILGHVFPVFLGFRGGKGVATTIGVILGTMPVVAAACVAAWLACVAIFRYVAVGSLAAAAMLPVAQLFTQRSFSEVLLGSGVALLIVLKHRSNIVRLLQGREPRVGTPS